MKEDEIIKALPKSFRIFLAVEEEARGEKTNNPALSPLISKPQEVNPSHE